ncbi:MAG: hybrid sensor histidine kinase/response regulator [Planctomycetes bacterium]|nr:hybrid sensor histidine kinase/response regulator [Planctomycetota bacterium]
MFFLDNTGFFALICLFIQCIIAWVFAAFFAALAPKQAPWVRRWFVAFIGLGLGLAGVSWRFLLAHRHMGDVAIVSEGLPMTRLFYGVYLAGKFLFLWCLVGGVAELRGGWWVRSPWLNAMALFALGAGLGAALPTIEAILLAQALPVMLAFAYSAWLLRSRLGEQRQMGRFVVASVLWAWAFVWLVYSVCTIAVGLLSPISSTIWNIPLQMNSFVDLTLQVVLSTGMVVLVMQQAQNAELRALAERDQLRERFERGEKTRAMSLLVSGVAHEINNPLTAILGHAEELASESPDVRRHAARVVTEQAERCRNIVQRLSILGRQAPATREPVDVEALVRRVADGFRPQFGQALVRLDLQLAPEHCILHAEPAALEQVLTNLLANALQVSAAGGLVVLATEVTLEHVRLLVDDQGPGVSPADRKHVFEPFWSTKQATKGTGLGLAVAKALVDKHGGLIEVGERPGGGARFVVTLPCANHSPGLKLTARPPLREHREPATANRPGLRLLCIDDEPMVRATIVRRAQSEGWQVVEAECAEVALERLLTNGETFDAIACDLRMPGIAGIGFHDLLLAKAPSLLQRVIFLTGDLVSPDAAAFAARCRVPIVTKPFLMNDLFLKLREAAGAEAAAGVREVSGPTLP